jgi:hypothetical protein
LTDNYARIVRKNIRMLFSAPPDNLGEAIGARFDGTNYEFSAFGRECRLGPEGIDVDGQSEEGVLGILISLYGLNAGPEPCRTEPLRSFKELPDSMPYAGAFISHTQQVLVPLVDRIESKKALICEKMSGSADSVADSGDFAIRLFPLPKIALCYIFYRADDDFPASVTCLYSHNAPAFLPTDALADVGEYTSKRIVELVEK